MRAAWRGALLALVAGVTLVVPAVGAYAAKPVFPSATGYLVDAAGVIPSADETRIETTLEQYHQRSGHELALAFVRTTGDASIEDYSADLFKKWGVGPAKTDLGVLLVIAVDDHHSRIETGYGAEGALTDIQAKQILGDITPSLAAGNFAAAADQGQQEIRVALGDQQPDAVVPQQPSQPAQRRSSGGASLLFFVLPLVFIMMSSLGGRRRRRRYGFGVPIFYGGGFGGGFGGGGFGGSSGGIGGGGGGGGGFGGFGGGSSGGGGASGSW